MRDQNLRNYELIAERVCVSDLKDVIDRASHESSQKCARDRRLKDISFHLENVDGIIVMYNVYRKHTFTLLKIKNKP